MRVISGIAKGRKLASFKGSDIRPTSDYARESLFNILGGKVLHSSFLDLFAGTGSIGLEALSRGAESVIFVEKRKASITLIKKNMQKCGFSEEIHTDTAIIKKDALLFLKDTKKQFDIIFVDPPYKTDFSEKTLFCLDEKNLLKPEGIIILEHYFKKEMKKKNCQLHCFRRKKIGDTAFSFFTNSGLAQK